MSRKLRLAGFLAAFFSVTVLAQTAGDAVSVDPVAHNVIIDNEFIRVFDARASRGTMSPMHSHPPTFVVSVGKARLRVKTPDGKTSLFDLNPGMALWIEGVQHSWEVLAGELHAIGVEIKSALNAEPPPAPTAAERSGDAVSVDPDVHHVFFENPHVRVYEGRASHGMKSPMHKHPPSLVVSLDWMRMKSTGPDGKAGILDFSPGMVLWIGDGLTHSWECLAGNGRAIVIEVKAAQAAMKP
ncbi:MAG: hypothetical protein WAW79_13205 [Steroidobacteraceae bacterium]